jgi:hypothetical protein
MCRKKFSTVLVVLGIFVCGTASSAVVKYNFSQSGYDEGAFVTGTFEGEDLNGDGFLHDYADDGITELDNELTAFSVEFSGNSIIPAFRFARKDIDRLGFTLVYEINGGPFLGDGVGGPNPFGDPLREILLADDRNTGLGISAGLGISGAFGTVSSLESGRRTTSSEFMKISAVPLPAAVWFFCSGLLGLLGIRIVNRPA